VRYGNQAGVDPSLVLGIAIKESSGRGQIYGYGFNEAFNEVGVFLTPLDLWPRPGGASIGITNIKPQVLATVQRAFPGEFKNVQWANLVGNGPLDFKVTAYYAKYIKQKLLPNAPTALRASYTSDQIIEGIYNGGVTNFTQDVVPAGRFGPVVSSYIDSIAPDVAMAQSVICQSGAYNCPGGESG
jgi:hypothetical protein